MQYIDDTYHCCSRQQSPAKAQHDQLDADSSNAAPHVCSVLLLSLRQLPSSLHSVLNHMNLRLCRSCHNVLFGVPTFHDVPISTQAAGNVNDYGIPKGGSKGQVLDDSRARVCHLAFDVNLAHAMHR